MLQKVILAAATLLVLDSCETPKKRFPASEYNGTTLSGLRVNPVVYKLAPKWRVKIHNGQKNEWGIGDLDTTEFELGTTKGLLGFQKYVNELRAEDEADAKASGKKKGFLPKSAAAAIEEIAELTAIV